MQCHKRYQLQKYCLMEMNTAFNKSHADIWQPILFAFNPITVAKVKRVKVVANTITSSVIFTVHHCFSRKITIASYYRT